MNEREESVVSRRLDSEAVVAQVLCELKKLPEGERVIIELSVWDELSYSEIAAALDIPVGTVRSRLYAHGTRLRNTTALQHLFLEEVE